MESVLSEVEFKNIKSQSLFRGDQSRKGQIDKAIIDLVDLINSKDSFFTTSSCSGRAILIAKESEKWVKKGCRWLYVNHDGDITVEEVFNCLSAFEEDTVLKFEPFILHIQCRTLGDAKTMQTCALQSGYRNSGITLGKHGKIILAVRSTLNIEVPIQKTDGELLVSREYVAYLVNTIKEKMVENEKQFSNFHKSVSIMYCE